MKAMVFWQNIPSILQVGLLRSLASSVNFEVVLVTESDVSPQRQQLGWRRPDFAPAHLIVAPSPADRDALISKYSEAEVTHIFTGLSGFPTTYRTLKTVSCSAATVGVFVEPGRLDDGMRAWARRARYTIHGMKWRHRLDFILATGKLGERYYSRCGFPTKKIFPFGYFVDLTTDRVAPYPQPASSRDEGKQPFHLLFVGELVVRKGLDILLRALRGMTDLPWQLEILGLGSDGNRFRALSTELGLEGRVSWSGALPNDVARRRMAQADVLVLPSRHDGWGAVVNEALHSGTKAVASDACGASDLLRDRSRGCVFRAGSEVELRDALHSLCREGPLTPVQRTRISEWASKAISPTTASRYLLDVAEFIQNNSKARPVPPWRAS